MYVSPRRKTFTQGLCSSVQLDGQRERTRRGDLSRRAQSGGDHGVHLQEPRDPCCRHQLATLGDVHERERRHQLLSLPETPLPGTRSDRQELAVEEYGDLLRDHRESDRAAGRIKNTELRWDQVQFYNSERTWPGARLQAWLSFLCLL
jgi:hypothetical protein